MTVTAPTAHASAFNIPISDFTYTSLGREVCVCVCVMQEPTTQLPIIDGARIFGVELVGTGPGPPPPPPPVLTCVLSAVPGMSQLLSQSFQKQRVQKLREGWRPPSMTAIAL